MEQQGAWAVARCDVASNLPGAPLYPPTHFDTVPPTQEGVMLTTFNGRWQRHDGFGLLAIALLTAAAIAIGYLTAGA